MSFSLFFTFKWGCNNWIKSELQCLSVYFSKRQQNWPASAFVSVVSGCIQIRDRSAQNQELTWNHAVSMGRCGPCNSRLLCVPPDTIL